MRDTAQGPGLLPDFNRCRNMKDSLLVEIDQVIDRMSVEDTKKALRSRLRSARALVSDSADRSERIVARLMALPQLLAVRSTAFYASIRDEVQTASAIENGLAGQQRLSLPVVVGDNLELFEIRSMDELQPGSFRVPEPSSAVRQDSARSVPPSSVDLIVVPGLGFDEYGGRIGYGRGFYDRLLAAAPQAVTVALAYECQIMEKVPMAEADVRVQFVVTEDRVIECAV